MPESPAPEVVLGANPFVGLEPRHILAAAARLGTSPHFPQAVLRGGLRFVQEVVGGIVERPGSKPEADADRRFRDPAWSESVFYRTLLVSYLALRRSVDEVIDGSGLDVRSADRARFATGLVLDALAPTNFVMGNPAVLKRTLETSGSNLWRGALNLARDVRSNGGMPSQVDRRPFAVGENVATSPGAVVHRNEVLELIQYEAATGRVFDVPLLMIPPQINKYYVMDLSPGRSFVEFARHAGLQFFAISWRNPTPAQRDWDLARYLEALLEAMDVIRDLTRRPELNVLGLCAGGVTTAALLGHLAAKGDDRVRSATFGVTALDSAEPSMVGMFVSERTLAAARRKARSKGMVEGRDMARAFSWLRANDLVWNYWVNNYLLGNDPPGFDVLYWNSDTTNLPAALHSEFLDILTENRLSDPGSLEVLGTPIDLRRVRCDAYVVAGDTDHITPWPACYRTTQLLGGRSEFVLSNSGHVQSLVNPPGNPKASYHTGGTPGPDPTEWLAGSTTNSGSWWEHWSRWITERSGDQKAAPRALGNRRHPPLAAAPGRYVHQR